MTLLELDKWVNHELLKGNEGETISSRLGRKIEREDCFWCRFFCRVSLLPLAIFFEQGGKHCRRSIQNEYREK